MKERIALSKITKKYLSELKAEGKSLYFIFDDDYEWPEYKEVIKVRYETVRYRHDQVSRYKVLTLWDFDTDDGTPYENELYENANTEGKFYISADIETECFATDMVGASIKKGDLLFGSSFITDVYEAPVGFYIADRIMVDHVLVKLIKASNEMFDRELHNIVTTGKAMVKITDENVRSKLIFDKLKN